MSSLFDLGGAQPEPLRRRQVYQGPQSASPSQGTGCWCHLTLGGPWDAASMDTIGLSTHVPDMQARHPKDWGPRKPPSSRLLLPPTPRGEAAASLRVSTATPACPPPKNINPRRLAQAPAHPARGGLCQGACPPSRRRSGMRPWLDANSNLAGRANSGHPQRLLSLRPQWPCWKILSGYHQIPRVPSTPAPVGLSMSTSVFFCFPCPPLPSERPIAR